MVSDPFRRDSSEQFGGLISVRLEKGWNRVLIKTNQRHTSAQLTVYLLGQNESLSPSLRDGAAGPPRLERLADSEFIYDIYGKGGERVGWYRFPLAPGTSSVKFKILGRARFYVNGEELPYNPASGIVRLKAPLKGAGLAAVRVVHQAGRYAGAAIPEPVKVKTEKGEILLGDWSEQGLRSYSGVGVYRRSFVLPRDYAENKLVLDLGRVDASASVRVNGKSAGIRGWAPYRFDITSVVRPGTNEVEITVANTLANHYAVGTPAVHVYERQTESGLFGPVRILPYARVELKLAQ